MQQQQEAIAREVQARCQQGQGLSPGPQPKARPADKDNKSCGQELSPGHGQGSASPDAGKGGRQKGSGKSTAEYNRLKRQRRKEKQADADRTNSFQKDGFRVPWFHRRGRFSYCKLRRITEQFIDKWKKKRQADWQVYNALKNSWEGNLNLWRNVLEFNPMLQTTRHWLQNDVFGKIGFPTPRIIEDVTGDGRAAFLKTELWPGGPSLSQLTGDAVPDLDTIGVLEHKDRKNVWDFWLTDYDPDFWMHVFEGDTLGKPRGNTSHGGKGKVAGGASSSNGDGQGLSLDLPRSSWLVFHGTSFHSGLCAICGNSLNRSESKRGKPSPGDAKAQEVARQTHGGRYETTAGRGVYCTQDWEKAYSYSLPFTDRRVSGMTIYIVLLLRVPGSLEDVGVTLSLGMAKHRTVRTQKDLDGNVMHLDSNWALFSRTKYAQELADSVRGTKESIEKNLFNRAVRKPEEEMKLVDVIKDAMNQTIPLDTELNKRNDRHAMQADADNLTLASAGGRTSTSVRLRS